MKRADKHKKTIVFADTSFGNKGFWEYAYGERPEANGVRCLAVIDNEPEVGEVLVIGEEEYGVCGKRMFYPAENEVEVWCLARSIRRANLESGRETRYG